MYSQIGSRGLPWTSVKSSLAARRGRAASQVACRFADPARVHSIAARASGLNQSISRPPSGRQVVVAGHADARRSTGGGRRRRRDPGRSRRRRRGARRRRPSRRRRGPRRGRRGWHGCPRGPRRAPRQPSRVGAARALDRGRPADGCLSPRRAAAGGRVARPGRIDRRPAALDDDEAVVGEVRERVRTPSPPSPRAGSTVTWPSGSIAASARRAAPISPPSRPGRRRGRRFQATRTPPGREQREGQLDELRQRAPRPGPSRPASARDRRGSAASASARAATAATRRSSPTASTRRRRGTGPSCRPSRRGAPGRPAGPPPAAGPGSRRRCRGRRTGRCRAGAEHGERRPGCRRRGGWRSRPGSRMAVRLIAAFQASSSRTWPSIAARASGDRASTPSAVERRVEGVAIRGRQGRKASTRVGSGSRGRSRHPSCRSCLRAVRAPLPASSFVTPRSVPRSSVARPVRGRVSPCPSRASLPRVSSVRMPDVRVVDGRRQRGYPRIHAVAAELWITRRPARPVGARRPAIRRAGASVGRPAGPQAGRPVATSPAVARRLGGAPDDRWPRPRHARRTAPLLERRPPRRRAPARAPRRSPSARPSAGPGRTSTNAEPEPGHGRDVEVAAHPPGEVAGDRQPEAGPVIRSWAGHPVEPLEDPARGRRPGCPAPSSRTARTATGAVERAVELDRRRRRA